jgi:hypothetical protein
MMCWRRSNIVRWTGSCFREGDPIVRPLPEPALPKAQVVGMYQMLSAISSDVRPFAKSYFRLNVGGEQTERMNSGLSNMLWGDSRSFSVTASASLVR